LGDKRSWADNIKIDTYKTCCEYVHWTKQARERGRWLNFVMTVMNIRISWQIICKSLSSKVFSDDSGIFSRYWESCVWRSSPPGMDFVDIMSVENYVNYHCLLNSQQ